MFEDEAADVPDADTEAFGDTGDVDQLATGDSVRLSGCGHGLLLGDPWGTGAALVHPHWALVTHCLDQTLTLKRQLWTS